MGTAARRCVLRVEGPAAVEIQHLAGVICERVNRFLGWRAVERVALRQAPLRRPSRTPAKRADAAAAARIAEGLSDVVDDDLKQRWRGSARPCAGADSPRAFAAIGKVGSGGGPLADRRAGATFALQDFPLNQQIPVMLTRRQFVTATAIFAFAGVAVSVLPGFASLALADTPGPDPAELAKPGPDGDVVLGSEKAPVTIIEYASMTCPHCAHFSTTTFPELEKRYIDTGKVRFIFREFPLDPLAAAGFMLRALRRQEQIHADRGGPVRQAAGLDGAKADPPLMAIAKQFGFTEQAFDQMPGKSAGARQHPGGA